MRPLTVSVPVAGALLDMSIATAYRAAEAGQLPVVPLGSRLKVSVAKLEALIGEPLSAERIAEATAKVAARRQPEAVS